MDVVLVADELEPDVDCSYVEYGEVVVAVVVYVPGAEQDVHPLGCLCVEVVPAVVEDVFVAVEVPAVVDDVASVAVVEWIPDDAFENVVAAVSVDASGNVVVVVGDTAAVGNEFGNVVEEVEDVVG